MSTNYVAKGDTLDYTNAGSAIASGDVVAVGAQIGIAADAIANGETGVLLMSGVFTVPKVTGAVIAQGEEVIYDSSASKFDDDQATPASGDISKCCVAVAAAGNGATTVDVKINVGVGVVA